VAKQVNDWAKGKKKMAVSCIWVAHYVVAEPAYTVLFPVTLEVGVYLAVRSFLMALVAERDGT